MMLICFDHIGYWFSVLSLIPWYLGVGVCVFESLLFSVLDFVFHSPFFCVLIICGILIL